MSGRLCMHIAHAVCVLHIVVFAAFIWVLQLKRVWHEIFSFKFFSWINFPQAPKYPIKTVSNFFENSRRYSRMNVYQRCPGNKREKIWRYKFLSCIVMLKAQLSALYTYRLNLCLFFSFMCRQADIGSTAHRRKIYERCCWHRWTVFWRCRWHQR